MQSDMKQVNSVSFAQGEQERWDLTMFQMLQPL